MKNRGGPAPISDLPQQDSLRLLAAVQALSQLREIDGVVEKVRTAARELVAADGIAVILRQGEEVYYAAEDAIGPLWLGQRFPMNGCIPGWSMRHGKTVVIEDVYDDPRVTRELYERTFVRSLAIVPIRPEEPLGALGAYWAAPHGADAREIALLEALAGATAVAMANAALYHEVQEAVQVRDRFLAMAAHELRTPLASLLLQVQRVGRKANGEVPLEPAPPALAVHGHRAAGPPHGGAGEYAARCVEHRPGAAVPVPRAGGARRARARADRRCGAAPRPGLAGHHLDGHAAGAGALGSAAHRHGGLQSPRQRDQVRGRPAYRGDGGGRG